MQYCLEVVWLSDVISSTDSSIQGFHICQAIWTAVYRQTLKCVRELQKGSDRFAIELQKREIVIGHVPQYYSCIYYYYYWVIGTRKDKCLIKPIS